jgi:CBS domain-containing protein
MGLLRLADRTPQVPPETTVLNTVRVMLDNDAAVVAVVHEHRILGIFTDLDLMKRVVRPGTLGLVARDEKRNDPMIARPGGMPLLEQRRGDLRHGLLEIPVRKVMTSPVQSVTDSTPVEHAINLMWEQNIRHLAIIDGNDHYLGMVALRYLLHDLVGGLELKVDDLERSLMADGPGG